MVLVVVIVTRAAIYSVTHDREAALTFSSPRYFFFILEETPRLLWMLQKTAFILRETAIRPRKDWPYPFPRQCVWPYPTGLAVLLMRQGPENLQFTPWT